MMYKTFKYSHGKEKYTEILSEHFKKALLQFRIGSHKLPVNNRKHFNVPRADRHCTLHNSFRGNIFLHSIALVH